jgi:hypothetical protein
LLLKRTWWRWNLARRSILRQVGKGNAEFDEGGHIYIIKGQDEAHRDWARKDLQLFYFRVWSDGSYKGVAKSRWEWLHIWPKGMSCERANIFRVSLFVHFYMGMWLSPFDCLFMKIDDNDNLHKGCHNFDEHSVLGFVIEFCVLADKICVQALYRGGAI